MKLFFFLSWVLLKQNMWKKHNKPLLGVISVRKKRHSEQMMKVHMVKYYSISNSFKFDWCEKEKQFLKIRNHEKNSRKNQEMVNTKFLPKFDILTLVSSNYRAWALKLSKHLKKQQNMFFYLHFTNSIFTVMFLHFLLNLKKIFHIFNLY